MRQVGLLVFLIRSETDTNSILWWTGAAVGAGTAILLFNPIAAVVVGGAAGVGYLAKKFGDSDSEDEKK